ncbi:MAG: hypothetical protein WCF84_25440 [Anaerolineae bacterium]
MNGGEYLIVARQRGLSVLEWVGDRWAEWAHGLADQNVTSVIAREGVILAGTTRGVWRSDDLGRTFAATGSLKHQHVRWMAFHPDVSDFEFAGTEPAGIFVSHDGGASWRECPEVAALRDRRHWSLPYSLEAGCVRGFAFNGARAFAAVEVGGVLRSEDRGETWRLAEGSPGGPSLDTLPPPFIYPDVHSIVVHPSSPDLVFAPTGDGFFRSTDGGRTWDKRYDCYVRAVWVNPDDPAHMVLGPADGVDRNGRIEVTRDGGVTWQPAAAGLGTPWRRHMVERFTQIDSELVAVLSNGEVLVSRIDSLGWRNLGLADVNAVTTMLEFKGLET